MKYAILVIDSQNKDQLSLIEGSRHSSFLAVMCSESNFSLATTYFKSFYSS